MRVRLTAFKGDTAMIEASKSQLRIEFAKNKALTDPSKIAVNVAPKTPGTGPGRDGKLEVEHIDSKAGNLPEDVTVSTQSAGGCSQPASPPPPPAAAAGGGAGGGARQR
eukprot:jgi/Undpi1/10985/HiC_scaffold_30.g13286.m1